MTLIAASQFVVAPGPGLIVWTALVCCALLAGLVTAAKGRWGWLLLGLLSGGIAWFVSAFLEASPDSLWARRFHSADRLRRLRGRSGLRADS